VGLFSFLAIRAKLSKWKMIMAVKFHATSAAKRVTISSGVARSVGLYVGIAVSGLTVQSGRIFISSAVPR
jgi:hypothetical protein